MLPREKGATRMATERARTGAEGEAVSAVVLLLGRYSRRGQSGGREEREVRVRLERLTRWEGGTMSLSYMVSIQSLCRERGSVDQVRTHHPTYSGPWAVSGPVPFCRSKLSARTALSPAGISAQAAYSGEDTTYAGPLTGHESQIFWPTPGRSATTGMEKRSSVARGPMPLTMRS